MKMIYLASREGRSAGRGHPTTCLAIALLLLLVAGTGVRGETKGAGMHPYPLWPSEPVPGWPGIGADEEHSLEALETKILGRPGDPRPAKYGQPEFLAYPGAVHHLRHFLQRYVPPYPLNNHKTLVKNFILHEMAQTKGQCIDFTEPVYYNPMYRPRMRTKKTRPPVKVFEWKPGSDPIALDIGALPASVYVIRPIVAAPEVTTVIDKGRKFARFKLSINDIPGDPDTVNEYMLTACALDNFYSVTEFFFHSQGDGRNFEAVIEHLPTSELDLVLYNVDLHDRFGEHARRAGKKRSVLGYMLPTAEEERQAVWHSNRAKDEKGYQAALKRWPAKTPEQQEAYDDLVWKGLMPPLNCHYGGGWYTQRIDLDELRLVRAPDSWRRLIPIYNDKEKGAPLRRMRGGGPLFFDCKSGRAYMDSRRVFRLDAPPFELRDAMVCRKVTTEKIVDGKKTNVTEYEEVGAVKDCSFTPGSGTRGDLRLEGEVVGKVNEFVYRGRLYKEGKAVDEEPHVATVPITRFYDKQLRTYVVKEKTLAPGLYYDSNAITGLNWGSNVTGTNHGKYFTAIVDWVKWGAPQMVRDQAMKFVRLVYDIPTLQVTRGWDYVAGFEGLDRGMLRTPGHAMGSGGSSMSPVEILTFYDTIFLFLQDNQEFASAVGRHVPWVKTPQDVIKLIDTYLVQDYANNVMKYRIFTDHEQAMLMTTAVLVQDDPAIGEPWVEFLFKRGWEYPQALSGLGDNMVTGADRDGGTTIGSFMYAMGGATKTMALLEKYMKYGGNPKYDVTDPRQYPAVRMKPYFLIEGNAAGRVNPGIGDVGGPAEYYGRLAGGLYRGIVEAGWRWHRDPKFAWELVSQGRQHETDDDWAQIEAAAKQCPRDPYLMNKSRVLSNWGGYLRHNADTDDWRFQRELSTRVGTGWGHAHSDTLDLRLFAFGMTMSGDFNQRPAYGWPAHHRTKCHNVVEVDGKDWRNHAWISNLFDAPGSPYLTAESVAPHGMERVKLFRRQCAYVRVQDGKPGEGIKDSNVTMPSQYALDVFRVSGGSMHTYCFHGCVDDSFEVNVESKRPPTQDENSPDRGYLGQFRWWAKGDIETGSIGGFPAPAHEYWVADCAGQDLVATWRLHEKAEKHMLRGSVVSEPRKFTRLTLLDQKGSKILHGHARAAGGKGQYGRCLYAQRGSRPEPVEGKVAPALDTVFVAIIEPYAGEPAVTSHRRLEIADNESDALRAVAIEVKTRNGHTDVLFADGRPKKVREVSGVRCQAEYAYLSRDGEGIRQATLTGGTLLEASDVKIEVETPRYEAAVTKVDYLGRKVTLKGRLPARLAGHFFEVGNESHKTSYEVSGMRPRFFRKTELTLRKGLEIMRTRVRSADPATGKVMGSIAMFHHRGRDAGLVASNDDLTRLWRVAYVGGNRHSGHEFRLTSMDPDAEGPAFKAGDFPVGEGLRVWEFGTGDTFRLQTGVSIRRTDAGAYEVYATAPCTLTLGGKTHTITEKKLAGGQRFVLATR